MKLSSRNCSESRNVDGVRLRGGVRNHAEVWDVTDFAIHPKYLSLSFLPFSLLFLSGELGVLEMGPYDVVTFVEILLAPIC